MKVEYKSIKITAEDYRLIKLKATAEERSLRVELSRAIRKYMIGNKKTKNENKT